MTWDLRLGSCLWHPPLWPVSGLASLADKSVDVVLTDPPYEAEAHTKQRRQLGTRRVPGGRESYASVLDTPLEFAAITAYERAEVARQIARVTRHRAIVFCQAEAIGEWKSALNAGGMPYRRSMPWTKPDAMPSLHGRWPGQSYEAIVLAMHPSAPACPVGGKSKHYEFTRSLGAAPHPTTKPLSLMRELVSDFTRPGDLVLDMFAGSGTTGLACNQLGRHFLGWELSPEYHAIATRRLNGDEAKPRPEQPGLFDVRSA